MKNSFWGNTNYYIDEYEIEERYVIDRLSQNRTASKLFFKGKHQKGISNFVGFIGWSSLAYFMVSSKRKWWQAGLGGSLTITSIVFNKIGRKKMRKAVDLFNSSDFGNLRSKKDYDLIFSMRTSTNGIGLSLVF